METCSKFSRETDQIKGECSIDLKKTYECATKTELLDVGGMRCYGTRGGIDSHREAASIRKKKNNVPDVNQGRGRVH